MKKIKQNLNIIKKIKRSLLNPGNRIKWQGKIWEVMDNNCNKLKIKAKGETKTFVFSIFNKKQKYEIIKRKSFKPYLLNNGAGYYLVLEIKKKIGNIVLVKQHKHYIPIMIDNRKSVGDIIKELVREQERSKEIVGGLII
jgi:hypothetical protein